MKTQTTAQRAPFNDWWYWSECLAKRFKTLAEIYNENGEVECGKQASDLAERLEDNCMNPVIAARKGVKTDEEKAEVKRREELSILEAVRMFRYLLADLPFISSAIQDFLYTYWEDVRWQEGDEEKANNARITELFWGPRQWQDEGIRSGHVEDGGLPGILFNLLQAEKTTSGRPSTDYSRVLQSTAFKQYEQGKKLLDDTALALYVERHLTKHPHARPWDKVSEAVREKYVRLAKITPVNRYPIK